jgi:hypothetical protein
MVLQERATMSTALRFVTTFRVDNRPIWMLGKPEMASGDEATVAGWDKGSAIKCFAIRNRTTGVLYTSPALKKLRSQQYVWLITPIVTFMCAGNFGVGGFFTGLVLSSPFLAIGAYLRKQVQAIARAVSQLETTSAAPSLATGA